MSHERPELIRQQMESTRSSLADKVEALEQKVVGTVQDTATAVSETVTNVAEQVSNTVQNVTDTVGSTVEAMKESVGSTVDAVKESVGSTVESVKETFNVNHHVQNYPWAALGVAAAAGFATGIMTAPPDRPQPRSRPFADDPETVSGRRTNWDDLPPETRKRMQPASSSNASNVASTVASAASAVSSLIPPSVVDHFKDSIERLEKQAIGTVMEVLSNLVTNGIQTLVPQQGDQQQRPESQYQRPAAARVGR